jgi:shikimate kinase
LDNKIEDKIEHKLDTESINFDLQSLEPPILIIIGPPGAGKTAVGKHLAKTLNWNFYDTDVLIEQASGMTIPEIFTRHREPTFRKLEKNLLNKMVGLCQKVKEGNKILIRGTIISCGGGLPVPPENFANLSLLGNIICLQASIETLIERMEHIQNRPLLDNSYKENRITTLKKLIADRTNIYAKAKYKIDTTNQNIEEVSKKIKDLLRL